MENPLYVKGYFILKWREIIPYLDFSFHMRLPKWYGMFLRDGANSTLTLDLHQSQNLKHKQIVTDMQISTG